ncbi:hypothetical protein COS81_01930 [candidate division WWE3 bacterium CG06_land_8_20_14_3_00_42_16]|uniref:Phage holin family protein n=4 Tax=Katanobacteria TaxID=422282 RepID=A0A2M7ANL5_UNCKA|nr:MAG: hypothetical protein AUJ38_01565 [bacterium CG1_02_42_9]PIU68979.1 MAG: hypothetical protein COS81_01930 [candidate division WWE3 bacterium CG06_land_8_20_14_3_00_42_16]PJA37902.1 MAG: hypothetical protein CO181_01675 [candidate division WWE3 bacterium CG_4_9_14_3_um_filter_43_9]PJC68101.1 MAG: hypothetical protein CO015_05240 [candidate division WWE3 bacterium CG_4_8_14_3_um_filter_42_11]
MKKLIRIILINMIAVGVAAYIVPGISYSGGVQTLALIAVVFAVINLFIKPIIKLLALPVEFLTLGLFSTAINAAMFYLTTRFVADLKISGFQFAGLSMPILTLQAAYIPFWGTALIGSVIIGIITTLLYWITD